MATGDRQVGVEAGAAGADVEKMATEKQIAANRRNALKGSVANLHFLRPTK
jgi:hypothetical protein